MDIEGNELKAILERVERLENQNRMLKRAGVVGVIFFSMVFLMGQTKPHRTIEAEQFILRDVSGKSRANLTMTLDRPRLTLSDAMGQEQVLLEGGDAPTISVSRTGGKEQVTVLASEEVYGVAVYGEPKGKINGTRIGLGVWKGVPGLTLYDEAGNERAAIDYGRNGPALKLENEKGYLIWSAP